MSSGRPSPFRSAIRRAAGAPAGYPWHGGIEAAVTLVEQDGELAAGGMGKREIVIAVAVQVRGGERLGRGDGETGRRPEGPVAVVAQEREGIVAVEGGQIEAAVAVQVDADQAGR